MPTKVSEVTPRQAAQRLGTRLDSLYALIWAGKIPAHKKEGRWLISLDAVEQRLKARKGSRNG